MTKVVANGIAENWNSRNIGQDVNDEIRDKNDF